jgi:F-type H+-transporting ATPase subunit gamma
MEMVAASKMRRAQNAALAARPYAEKMNEVLADLACVTSKLQQSDLPHPLLRRRERKAVGLVVITTDRGLAGGLNTNVLQKAAHFMLEQGVPTKVIAVGRKGRDWLARRGVSIINEFTQLGDRPDLADTFGVSHSVIDGYMEGAFDEVYVIYSDFISTLVQKPVVVKLLPFEPSEQVIDNPIDYIYEPDPAQVLAELLPRYIEMVIYHAVLESRASEESARMVSMRNATENAEELIQDLTLNYNRVRQSVITSEIAEIAAAEAVLK